MKLACVLIDDLPCAAVVSDDVLIVLPFDTPLAAWRAGPDAIAQATRTARRLPLAGARLLAPVPAPQRILGLGLNYLDHVREGGREPPAAPVWFNKQTTAVNGPMDDVLMPVGSEQLDYEVELVVIIGRSARRIGADQALAAVAGYAVGCDFSVRDWQKRSPTMTLGKSGDSHAPFGPWMTTADAVADPQDLHLTCHVNGAPRQTGHTADMVFSVAEQIAYLSQHFTLRPGDVLFTGTPAGVGQWRTPPLWLTPGDVVDVAIDGLGALRHTIVADARPCGLDVA